jgi:hypothetical protein
VLDRARRDADVTPDAVGAWGLPERYDILDTTRLLLTAGVEAPRRGPRRAWRTR